MSSKLLSVIVAGGTGSTGREIVSKLVAHPKVGRVVVLSRYAIPVNRWQTFFPNIRTADALRHLSIVDVNWQKLYEDMLPIDLNALIDGGHCDDHCATTALNDAFSSRRRGEDQLTGATFASSAVVTSSSARSCRGDDDDDRRGRDLDSAGWPHHEDESAAMDADALSSRSSSKAAPTYPSADDDSPTIGNTRRRTIDNGNTITSNSNDAEQGGRASTEVAVDEAPRKLRRTLHALASSTYYRSIFSGHHVAINCLGSHNLLNPWGVNAVDHNFAIAFAKLVRVFNCYLEDRDAEATTDELEALRESARLLKYDATMWAEVCSAYLGKPDGLYTPVVSPATTSGAAATIDVKQIDAFLAEVAANRQAALLTPSSVRSAAGQQRRPTLLHYAQISAAGASRRSPLPYFSAHGACDEETARLFCTKPPIRPVVPPTTITPQQEEKGATNTTSCVSPQLAHRFVNPLSLDIYKPALLKRPNARWWERILQSVAPPVSVEALSSMVVEDILLRSQVFYATPATAPTYSVNDPKQKTPQVTKQPSAATTPNGGDIASTALLEQWRRLSTDATFARTVVESHVVSAKEIVWRAHKYELRNQKAATAATSRQSDDF